MPFRLAAALCAALLATAMPALAQAAPEGRVIVKFKSDAKVLQKARDWPARTARRAAAPTCSAQRMGLALDAGHEIAERVQVVRAPGVSSEALAQALAADPDVEFAVPDGAAASSRRRTIRCTRRAWRATARPRASGTCAHRRGTSLSSINAEARGT